MGGLDMLEIDHPKRRRRRPKRPPIYAKLILDNNAKGDIGTISQDLFADFFGRPSATLHSHNKVRHVAIAPWRPQMSTLVEDCPWVILPVKVQEPSGTSSSISFPASALSLQSFKTALQANRSDVRGETGIDVLILDVQPLTLGTIFVNVSGEALQKHQEVQKKFGGGFFSPMHNAYAGKGKGKAPGTKPASSTVETTGGLDKDLEDRLRVAIRASLSQPHIVHRNDLLPLPLPSHPITHEPFPPIEVTICEPVDQGLISGDTKVVINMDYHGKGPKSRSINYSTSGHLQETVEEEDTSTDQFYSAAENGSRTESAIDGDTSTDEASSATDTSADDDESSSDDDTENIISLSSPSLPMQASGVISARISATPRPFGMKASGVHTPGSVFSNYTATTARQGVASGKLFHVKALITKVSDGVLHPPPSSDEDDEARVFVDVKVLARLGCFSGDWVKLTAAESPSDSRDRLCSLGSFGDDESVANFRAIKIFGLPDTPGSDLLQYPKTEFARRMSLSQSSMLQSGRPKPTAYISPVLLSNLGEPTTISIAPLLLNHATDRRFTKSKLASSAKPPTAKEITLLRLPTPLFTERTAQAGLFAHLKQYFASRRRILKTGDTVAVRVDLGVSRIFSAAGSGTDQDLELEELLASSNSTTKTSSNNISIAWFKVGQIFGTVIDDDQPSVDTEIWGGAASIEPMITRMAQFGSAQGVIPSTLSVPWDHYMGVKKCPRTLVSTATLLQTKDSIREPYVSSARRRIRQLLAATTTPRAIQLAMNPMVILLHSTQRSIGKTYLVSAACSNLGLHVFPIDAYDILTEGAGGGDVKTVGTLEARIDRALDCGVEYTVPVIRHVEALTADRIAASIKGYLRELRALVITTTEIEKIPDSVRSLVTHEIEVSAPDEKEREGILREIINDRGIRLAHDVDLAGVAVKTAALVAGDLMDVVERALVARQERLESITSENGITKLDILISGGIFARCVTKPDLEIAVDAARKNFADSIGAPKIPNVSWDDVGGLSNVKDAVMETIQLPLERPELFAKGMKKRSGILFYGPPGTGKTLLAKAIATEFSLNFFSVKGPELLNMYIGESEANVRRVFQRARDARPCVVFFDELDSVAPKRGNQGDSGGVMDRIVSQLLAELDGMSDGDGGGGGVFVIGATNRPDLLDQALLRPGRFDKMLYLGISDTHDKQLTILEALARKFTLHPDMSLRRVAESLPYTYTGADLYALCSDAMLKAITRQATAVDAKIKALPDGPVTTAYFFDHYATDEDIAVMVKEQDFFAAQRELIGSVSAKELEHYQKVRQTFEGKSQSPSKGDKPATPTQKNGMKSTQASAPDPGLFTHDRPEPKSRISEQGKGKAVQKSDYEDEDDEAYVTSNDYATPATYSSMNVGGKGKGKAKALDGFGDDEEDDLYG